MNTRYSRQNVGKVTKFGAYGLVGFEITYLVVLFNGSFYVTTAIKERREATIDFS